MGGNEKVKMYVERLMKKEGMKPEKLAKLANMSLRTVHNFLLDIKPVSLRGADKLLGVFGLEIKIGKKQKERNDGQ